MIAITFALPEESREMAHSLRHAGRCGSAEFPALLGNLGSREVLLVHTGMGMARARQRMAALLKERGIDCIISAGFAGGLDPRLPAGALLLARNYSSPGLLAQARDILGARASVGPLATSATVLETPAAKAAFARQTGAWAVDMETAAIAALCQEHGTPLLALRAISDGACEELAVPFSVCFDAEAQRPRPLALAGFLARHPSRLGGFIRFLREVNTAKQALAGALVELVEHPLFGNGAPALSQSR